jgi:CubicO group peptidase (beta-lactamase class C family)
MNKTFLTGGLERLVRVLQSEIDGHRLPGCVVWVARGGTVALYEALGKQVPADDARNIAAVPMRQDSIFRIYSMTKPIVSVATMMLTEEGKLVLSDPVGKYIPAFAKQQVMQADGSLRPAARAATLQDLLRHTAGLTYEFLGTNEVQKAYVAARMGTRGWAAAEQIPALGGMPLIADPGTLWEYSRATDVLGHVLEVVSGQPLQEVLHSRVLGPLGMSDTGFHLPVADHARLAEPFKRDPEGAPLMKVYDPRQPSVFESGGGGLLGTAADYGRFMQMMLNGGELDGARLLGPQTVAYMTSDHLGWALPGGISVCKTSGSPGILPPGYGFGLGFAVRQGGGVGMSPGSAGLHYWGGLAGTTFFIDPAQQLCATLMLQAPNQREYYRHLFRNLVYSALAD